MQFTTSKMKRPRSALLDALIVIKLILCRIVGRQNLVKENSLTLVKYEVKSEIPTLVNLITYLFIFKKDRKCLLVSLGQRTPKKYWSCAKAFSKEFILCRV